MYILTRLYIGLNVGYNDPNVCISTADTFIFIFVFGHHLQSKLVSVPVCLSHRTLHFILFFNATMYTFSVVMLNHSTFRGN